MRRFLLFLWLMLIPASALAAPAWQKVQTVLNAKNIVLENGDAVRLAALQAPNLPEGPEGGEPLAQEAQQALAALVEGKRVRLVTGGAPRDRRQRIIAQLYDESGRWIQCEMLRQGYAIVYSFPDQEAFIPDLLTCEKEARHAGRGIWGNPYYRILTPENAGEGLQHFRLVEGTVKKAAEAGGKIYLNFGDDWKTDFTAVIAGRDKRRFDLAAVTALEGRHVRLRGWLKEKNGPMIELTHPGQIEPLEGDQGGY